MSHPLAKMISVACATTFGGTNFNSNNFWTLKHGQICSLRGSCMPRIMRRWAGWIPLKNFSPCMRASLSRISRILRSLLKKHKIVNFSQHNFCRLSWRSSERWSRYKWTNLTRLWTTKRSNTDTNTKRRRYTSKNNKFRKGSKCPNTSKNKKTLLLWLLKKLKSRSRPSWFLSRCRKR